jgi:hypothetical protein
MPAAYGRQSRSPNAVKFGERPGEYTGRHDVKSLEE